ncbi:MAG: hypothetical protein K9L02_03550 [Acholeplasmataceae bacterium]|nr:hypothetical protein [Acholeplasmataceae bacterium]
MKNIIKFIMILGTFALVYYAGDLTIKYFMPENRSIANSSLLFLYGGMLGYILLIIFVVVLQKNNYDQLRQHKPLFGKLLHSFHVMLAIVFISYALISFDIQFSVLLVLIFLFVSTLLDYVRERLMQEINGSPIPPKKIL